MNIGKLIANFKNECRDLIGNNKTPKEISYYNQVCETAFDFA